MVTPLATAQDTAPAEAGGTSVKLLLPWMGLPNAVGNDQLAQAGAVGECASAASAAVGSRDRQSTSASSRAGTRFFQVFMLAPFLSAGDPLLICYCFRPGAYTQSYT